MVQTEIIEIIKSKDSWVSSDLIKLIKTKDKKRIKIKFCHIGGYECLRNGTKTKTCKSLQDIKDILNDYEIEYNETINEPIKLVKSIEGKWSETWNDGGGSGSGSGSGSGWIEC